MHTCKQVCTPPSSAGRPLQISLARCGARGGRTRVETSSYFHSVSPRWKFSMSTNDNKVNLLGVGRATGFMTVRRGPRAQKRERNLASWPRPYTYREKSPNAGKRESIILGFFGQGIMKYVESILNRFRINCKPPFLGIYSALNMSPF